MNKRTRTKNHNFLNRSLNKNITIFLLTMFVSISLFIRLFGLEISPASVGFDEASLGYNAYSILLTGKDEYGNLLPLSLRSFNDFKPALYAYLEIPFIRLLGLNQTSLRAPSALFGTISLIFLILIFAKISGKSIKTSIIVLAFISFLPWRLHFSRVAFEANISMAFFTGIIWCLINFNKNIFYKIGTIVFSTLSIYSYHSARVAVPIILFLNFTDPFSHDIRYIFKRPAQYLKNLWPLFIVIILFIPLFLEFQSSFILTRFSQTNIFSHYYPFSPSALIFTKNIWLNPLANPIYYLVGILAGHISSYISPQNLSLIIYPGVIKSAQAIGGSGMLGFLGGIFFVFGVFTNFRDVYKNKNKRIIIYWIIAGIIPAAITWEWFYPLRSLNIYPVLDIFICLGLINIFDYLLHIKHKLLKYISFVAIVSISILTSFYNTINEFNYGSWEISGEFQPGGFKESAELLMSLKNKYSIIYLDSNHAQSYEIFWFYMKYPPQNIQYIAKNRNQPGTEGPPTINFDNFIYKKYDWTHDKYKDNFIYWTNSEVKEEEIKSVPNAKLYKILDPSGNWIASVITKS